jgi:TetR/AcrR family transcriptional repressor of mexJK operon
MSTEFTEQKRLSIIDSATRMFLTHGYRNASMDKIAQAAPVSKATLYNHFDNKEALLAAVISKLSDALLATMNQASIDSEDVENNLRKIADSFVELIFSPDALAILRLAIAESRDLPQLSQLFYDSGPKMALQQLEAYLRQLDAGGQLNIANPAFAADAFFSLLKGDLHLQCLLGKKNPPSILEKQQLASDATAFYMRGILLSNR